MAQDWDIRPRSDACTACETSFEDGQEYVSAIWFDGDAGYGRGDYHEACWKDAQDRVDAFSTWKSVFRLPPPPAEEALKKETAESLLRKLLETDEDASRNAVYILAVMLERKRTFVEREVEIREEDERKVRVYEHRKTHETFFIPEPDLRLDQLEEVQKEVLALLDHSQPAAPDAPADGAEPAGTS